MEHSEILTKEEFCELAYNRSILCVPAKDFYIDILVQFSQVEFLDYLKAKNINTVFYDFFYPKECDFLITGEAIENSKYLPLKNLLEDLELNPDFAISLDNEIHPDKDDEFTPSEFDSNIGLSSLERKLKKNIMKYNGEVDLSSLNDPTGYVAGCIDNGKMVGILFEAERPSVSTPELKLYDLLFEFEEEAKKKAEKKAEEMNLFKSQLKAELLSDQTFLICSNKHLREKYAQSMWDGEKKSSLKKYFASGFLSSKYVSKDYLDFIELVYKEYRINKMESKYRMDSN